MTQYARSQAAHHADKPMPVPKAIYAKHEGKCSCGRGVGVGQSVLWINTAGVVGCRYCKGTCGAPERGGETDHPLSCTEMPGHEEDHVARGNGGGICSKWINREPPRSQYATVDDVRRLYGDDGQPHLFGVVANAPTQKQSESSPQVFVSTGQRTRLHIGDYTLGNVEISGYVPRGHDGVLKLTVRGHMDDWNDVERVLYNLSPEVCGRRPMAIHHPAVAHTGFTHVEVREIGSVVWNALVFEVAIMVGVVGSTALQQQQAMTDAFRAVAEPLPIYGATFHRALPTGGVVPYRCISVMGATRTGQLGAVLLAESGDTHVVDCATIDSARIEWFRSADNAARAARHMLAESAPTLVKHETSPLRLACERAIADYQGMYLTAYTRAVTHLAEPSYTGEDMPPHSCTVALLHAAIVAVERGIAAGHTWKRVKRDVEEEHHASRMKYSHEIGVAVAVYVQTRRGHTRS